MLTTRSVLVCFPFLGFDRSLQHSVQEPLGIADAILLHGRFFGEISFLRHHVNGGVHKCCLLSVVVQSSLCSQEMTTDVDAWQVLFATLIYTVESGTYDPIRNQFGAQARPSSSSSA